MAEISPTLACFLAWLTLLDSNNGVKKSGFPTSDSEKFPVEALLKNSRRFEPRLGIADKMDWTSSETSFQVGSMFWTNLWIVFDVLSIHEPLLTLNREIIRQKDRFGENRAILKRDGLKNMKSEYN